jgi:hypothetical protein
MNRIGICALAGVLLFGATKKTQSAGKGESLLITVQVLDGRNGKPLADQHVLVFTGISINAAKSHAAHTELTTEKTGAGTLTIYPAETQWLQVFTDGRVLCYPNPNQSSFSVSEIMSKGLATPNDCGALIKEPSAGRFIIFARPPRFMEKMKQ